MPLPISPLLAFAEEIGPIPDHTRVVLRGFGLTGAKVGEEAEFIIDGSEAGPGKHDFLKYIFHKGKYPFFKN